ncbi:hypothetical protein C8R46DRAFT_1027535 [Mycena filopes]|nr:hypothetical protein C8R46DRAFT_1027535 [Mycena filopes]
MLFSKLTRTALLFITLTQTALAAFRKEPVGGHCGRPQYACLHSLLYHTYWRLIIASQVVNRRAYSAASRHRNNGILGYGYMGGVADFGSIEWLPFDELIHLRFSCISRNELQPWEFWDYFSGLRKVDSGKSDRVMRDVISDRNYPGVQASNYTIAPGPLPTFRTPLRRSHRFSRAPRSAPDDGEQQTISPTPSAKQHLFNQSNPPTSTTWKLGIVIAQWRSQ